MGCSAILDAKRRSHIRYSALWNQRLGYLHTLGLARVLQSRMFRLAHAAWSNNFKLYHDR
jgi:hypothetical protein